MWAVIVGHQIARASGRPGSPTPALGTLHALAQGTPGQSECGAGRLCDVALVAESALPSISLSQSSRSSGSQANVNPDSPAPNRRRSTPSMLCRVLEPHAPPDRAHRSWARLCLCLAVDTRSSLAPRTRQRPLRSTPRCVHATRTSNATATFLARPLRITPRGMVGGDQ